MSVLFIFLHILKFIVPTMLWRKGDVKIPETFLRAVASC